MSTITVEPRLDSGVLPDLSDAAVQALRQRLQEVLRGAAQHLSGECPDSHAG